MAAISHKWSNVRIKMADDPFAQGEQRISFHGSELDIDTGIEVRKIVVKEFKHYGKGRDRRQDYVEIMETQAAAAYLADTFNKISPKGTKRIEFLRVC